MSNDNNHSIHEFDFSLICEYFSSLRRQGPGSNEATLRALSFVGQMPQAAKIADIGCGTGSSALLLAQHTQAHISALDLFPDFLAQLRARAEAQGLSDRIETTEGSMEALPYGPEELDLIWSEGAIYNIGFERGLREWRKHLKVGGYIAVSESTWLTDQRPEEIEAFWNDAYPEMDTMANKIATMQGCGYRMVAAFVLPDDCWTTNYYRPQEEAQRIFEEKHRGNATAEMLIGNQRHEAELYGKYSKHYGYVFYIGQKV